MNKIHKRGYSTSHTATFGKGDYERLEVSAADTIRNDRSEMYVDFFIAFAPKHVHSMRTTRDRALVTRADCPSTALDQS